MLRKQDSLNYKAKFQILKFRSLATKAASSAVENKIPSVSSLVKKIEYDTKVSQLEKKITDDNNDNHITAPEFNTLAASVLVQD